MCIVSQKSLQNYYRNKNHITILPLGLFFFNLMAVLYKKKML